MAISGIVINLGPDSRYHHRALERLSEMPQLELGPSTGPRVPAVMSTKDVKGARACWDDIMGLLGVEGIDLVFVHYENETLMSDFGTVEEADK